MFQSSETNWLFWTAASTAWSSREGWSPFTTFSSWTSHLLQVKIFHLVNFKNQSSELVIYQKNNNLLAPGHWDKQVLSRRSLRRLESVKEGREPWSASGRQQWFVSGEIEGKSNKSCYIQPSLIIINYMLNSIVRLSLTDIFSGLTIQVSSGWLSVLIPSVHYGVTDSFTTPWWGRGGYRSWGGLAKTKSVTSLRPGLSNVQTPEFQVTLLSHFLQTH